MTESQSTWNQPMLPLNDSQVTQTELLRGSRNDACKKESKLLAGKRLEVFLAISEAAAGMTMRDMADVSGRGINCWTQPFKDLRRAGVIEATNLRRRGGIVYQLVKGKVFNGGDWQ